MLKMSQSLQILERLIPFQSGLDVICVFPTGRTVKGEFDSVSAAHGFFNRLWTLF